MIILKVSNKNTKATFTLNLNSNMIILKEILNLMKEESWFKFKFQYDNT